MSQLSFYNQDNFVNTVYAVDIAIENYFAGLLFDNDTNRLVYSSTDYAFRKRAEGNQWSNAQLPFLNYRLDTITPDTDRNWYNHHEHNVGLWVEELGRPVKFTPVKLQYDATVFYARNDDALYAFSQVYWDDTQETKLEPVVEVETKDGKAKDEELKLIALLGYNLQFNPDYGQSDWLERNRIHSVRLDFEIDTFLILDDVNVSLTEEAILEFAASHDKKVQNFEEAFEFLKERFSVEEE